jgi:oligopeptide/dipeptide ABC transporter ATP-binding protein
MTLAPQVQLQRDPGARTDLARRAVRSPAVRLVSRRLVWQDPFSSLDPKWQVHSIVAEPLAAHRVGTRDTRRRRAEELLDLVGLDPARYAGRHPRELSGGQAQRVAVMYLGRFCEIGPGESVYKRPLHPYTKALLDSVPSAGPGAARPAATLRGEPPSPVHPPSGCRFRTRCPRAADKCASAVPEPRELAPGHLVACLSPLTEPAQVAAPAAEV